MKRWLMRLLGVIEARWRAAYWEQVGLVAHWEQIDRDLAQKREELYSEAKVYRLVNGRRKRGRLLPGHHELRALGVWRSPVDLALDQQVTMALLRERAVRDYGKEP